jgi:hypothetical protein
MPYATNVSAIFSEGVLQPVAPSAAATMINFRMRRKVLNGG